MIWYLVGAGVAALLAGGMLYPSRRAQARHRSMYLTETTTTSTLRSLQEAATSAAGAGAFRQQVELSGRTVAAPSGLLTSEMAKAPCVWHRHRVTRKYREVSRDSKGNRRTSTREEVMTEDVTPDAFLLRDGGGEITIVPSGEVDGARKSLSEFREENQDRTEVKIGSFSFSFAGSGDGDTLGYEYEEWVLPPDTAIFVQGEASDRDGALQVAKPEGKGDLFISTKSEADLLKDASHDARLYGVLAAVAAVAAVVLVVLAVVL
jgi:hypothetical protein